VTCATGTSHDLTGMLACEAPERVSLLPAASQQFTAMSGGEARAAFYASLPEDAPVDSYPVRVRGAMDGGAIGPVIVTLVKLPHWRVGAGEDAEKAQWREAGDGAISADGYLDAGRVLEGDVPRRCFGTTSFVSPTERSARLLGGQWRQFHGVVER